MLLYYFQMHHEDFMSHYYLRNNIEATNIAIKTKPRDYYLKNKNFVSQTNGLLCKLIAYNITVLINIIYELNIDYKLTNIP